MNKQLILILLLVCFTWHTQAQMGLVCGESITVNDLQATDFIIPDGANSIRFNLRGGDGGNARLSGATCDVTLKGGEAATVIVEYQIGLAPNQLKAGGRIRTYAAEAGVSFGTVCAPPNPNVNTQGGGSTGVLYLPPGSAATDDWYLLAVAGGGGGGARPIANLFREGLGGNASELGTDFEGNFVGTPGFCGVATLVGNQGDFTGVGAPGGGIFCNDSGDEDAAETVIQSAFYDVDSNLLIQLKDTVPANGFTGGGKTIRSGRGAGGGGGFSGGYTRSNFAAGGGGSYFNEYFINLAATKLDGAQGGSTQQDGRIIITTNGMGRNEAVCQDATVTPDAFGDYTLLATDIDGGSFGDCNEVLQLTFVDDSFSKTLDCTNLTQTVTLKVNSVTGDPSTCDATVTLIDDVAPTISCQSATIYLNTNGVAQLTQEDVVASTSDNCAVQSVTLGQTQFDCSALGVNSVAVIVADEAANKDTCFATVSVLDTIAPVYNQNVADTLFFTCGGSLTDQPTATDNCDGNIEGITNDPLDYPTQGTYTVTWQYEDISGNVSTSTQTVIVQSGVIYVDENAQQGQQTGDSWADAFSTLQQALDAAENCNGNAEIWVADGTYIPSKVNESIVFGGSLARKAVFYIDEDGIQLYGGFSGLNGAEETSRDQRDPELYLTILNGNRGDVNVATDNCYRVIYLDGATQNGVLTAATVVDGFTIKNGNADFFGANGGSGMYIAGNLSMTNATTPIINNCKFEDNDASFAGAGIYIAGFNGNCSPTITNCTFSNNSANNFGAGIHFDAADGIVAPLIQGCIFKQNSSNLGSAINIGGFGMSDLRTRIINCVFDSNGASHIRYEEGETGKQPTITNCTFHGATTEAIRIGVYGNSNSPIDFTNCIFWNNAALTNNTAALAPQFCITGDDN
ncbi:MAG: hypothetical protein AAF847_12400, partial [Bacteroidota bacterium]